MEDERPHESIWLWVASAWILVGIAIAGGYSTRATRFDLVVPLMLLAYACGVLAIVCVVGAVRGWRFPFTKGRYQQRMGAPVIEPDAIAVHCNFWFHSLKVDLTQMDAADQERLAKFWFHFESTADIPLAYRVAEGHVRAGSKTSTAPGIGDQYFVPPKGEQDYAWFDMAHITREDLRDVEIHLVVHYGRPSGGPWFAMDCLVQPIQSAWWDNGWPRNWVWRNKRETTHELTS